MEYQQAVVRAPRMARINWTQTTTITIAAFLGCLAAMALLFYLYRSFLGKSIRERMARVDQLDRQTDEAEDYLSELNNGIQSANRNVSNNQRRAAPVVTATVTSLDDDDENDENIELETPKGEPVATIPVV